MKLTSLPLMLSLFGLASRPLQHSFDGTLRPWDGDGAGTQAKVKPSSDTHKRPASNSGGRARRRQRLAGLRYAASAFLARAVRRKRVLGLNADEKATYLALRGNVWFDPRWYNRAYSDVAEAAIDPLHHFVRYGIPEGRQPRAIPIAASPAENRAHHAYLEAVADLGVPAPVAVPLVQRTTVDKGQMGRFSDEAVTRAIERLERFPLFKEDDYFSCNEPLRAEPGLISHRHALTYGFSEGRAIFSRQTIANELGLRARATTTLVEADARPCPQLEVSVVFNASGNCFLREIAECLAVDLDAAGHDVALLTDADDPSDARGHNIIVAPQEFFFLGHGAKWLRDDILRRSVLYNTEQPQTIWFDRAVPFNLLSKGVIDLAPQLASIYADCMPALFCDPVGPAVEDRLPKESDPILRVLPARAKRLGDRDAPLEKRSIDVSFFGGTSAHRERFFAKTARFFADYQTFIYCRRNGAPLLDDDPVDLLAAARHVGFHSKIVLNIHREEFGFFEWHRIVRLGIETGAVVVSEPCLPHPGLKPNVHYFEESGRHIQNLVEWLLHSDDGRAEHAKVRSTALAYVDARRASGDAGRRIGRFLDELHGGDV